jgi:putative flippase GtrA
MNDAKTLAPAKTPLRFDPAALWRAFLHERAGWPLVARYIAVSGVIGVPGSILQLMLLIALYERGGREVGTLSLNALWIVNFELGLLRNFALHCLFTWRTEPTWRKVGHAHVAASGAVVIDLLAFNLVVFTTGIIPLAQVAGAGSGFLFNYGYNALKTFARSKQTSARGGMA